MRRLFNLLGVKRNRMEEDLRRELQYHMDRRKDDLRSSGLREEDARRQAAIEFGGVAQIQEEVRDLWFSRFVQDLSRDVRYGLRVLWGSPDSR